jgi:hypothetical protein
MSALELFAVHCNRICPGTECHVTYHIYMLMQESRMLVSARQEERSLRIVICHSFVASIYS